MAYSNNADASVSINLELLNESLKLPLSFREILLSGANPLNSVSAYSDKPSLNYTARAQTDFSEIKLVTDIQREKYTVH